jgi:hypothetical protein
MPTSTWAWVVAATPVLGQPLVRIEAPIGLRKLYECMPDLRIDLSQPVEYVPSFGVSNIARFRATWTPRLGSTHSQGRS